MSLHSKISRRSDGYQAPLGYYKHKRAEEDHSQLHCLSPKRNMSTSRKKDAYAWPQWMQMLRKPKFTFMKHAPNVASTLTYSKRTAFPVIPLIDS